MMNTFIIILASTNFDHCSSVGYTTAESKYDGHPLDFAVTLLV